MELISVTQLPKFKDDCDHNYTVFLVGNGIVEELNEIL
jgi:hypothetical protein